MKNESGDWMLSTAVVVASLEDANEHEIEGSEHRWMPKTSKKRTWRGWSPDTIAGSRRSCGRVERDQSSYVAASARYVSELWDEGREGGGQRQIRGDNATQAWHEHDEPRRRYIGRRTSGSNINHTLGPSERIKVDASCPCVIVALFSRLELYFDCAATVGRSGPALQGLHEGGLRPCT